MDDERGHRTIEEGSVRALLEGIASTAPSPGSGAAGALALALGVACAGKAVRISLKHDPANQRLIDADARLSVIAEEALAAAETDTQLFADLIAALQLPSDDETEKAARSTTIRCSAEPLVELAEHLAELCQEVEQIISATRPHVDPAMANDLIAALKLTESASAIQKANAAENRRHV